MTPSVFAVVFVVAALVFVAFGMKIGAVIRAWRVEQGTSKAAWVMRIVNVVVTLVFLAAWGFVAFAFGAYITAIGMYDRQSETKLAKTKEVLASENAVSIEASKTSDGHVFLSGSVDAATHGQLLGQFRFNFGDSEATEMMRSVKVK